MSRAAIVTWSWVLLTKVVGRAAPFHCTTDAATKPLPLTVRVKSTPPAVKLLGASELSVGGGGSGALPVTIREMVSPSAAKLTFVVAVADVVGVKRTVTAWIAPSPARVKGLPATTLKGAEVDTAPETVPLPVFCTVKV